jgi:hypothetical protein
MEIRDRLAYINRSLYVLSDGVNGSSTPQSVHIEKDRWGNHSWLGFGSRQRDGGD